MPSPYGSTGSLDTTLKLLVTSRDQTAAFYDAPPQQLDRSYSPLPGKWTMRQLLIHIADSEAVSLERLCRVIAEDAPLLVGFNENHWAQRLAYAQRSLTIARQLFLASRDTIIELARLTPPARRQTVGFHTERGTVTFLEQLDTIAGHTQHHLTQLRAIAGDRAWVKPT